MWIEIALVTLLGASWAQAQAPAKPQPPPAAAAAKQETGPEEMPLELPGAVFSGIAARVNGAAIYGRDLQLRVNSQLVPLGNPSWANLREDYRQQLVAESLGFLVAAELLYQQAVASGVKATDAEVKTEFDKALKEAGGDAEFNISLANRGMDRAGYRRELARNLTVSRYIEQNVSKKVTLTPAEVSDYYAANKARFEHPELLRTSHILIMVPDSATPDFEKMARQRAEALLVRARKGEDFARLARDYSMEASASNGGDLGLVPRGRLAPEYEAAALALPVGGIGGVVRTQMGFHIIKVTEKQPAGLTPLEKIRSELTELLKNERIDNEVEKVVQELRGAAKIEILISVDGKLDFGGLKASSPRP